MGSGKPYIFVIFQGVRTPCPHSGFAHGMHLKEGTCLISVIIGCKFGLDYNSAPDQARPTIFLQTLIHAAGRKSRERERVRARESERERECARARERVRERETARCLHTNLLSWLGFLEYRNTVNQSCYNCFRSQTYLAHRLLYGKVGHSTVLTLCVLSIACTHF